MDDDCDNGVDGDDDYSMIVIVSRCKNVQAEGVCLCRVSVRDQLASSWHEEHVNTAGEPACKTKREQQRLHNMRPLARAAMAAAAEREIEAREECHQWNSQSVTHQCQCDL